MKEGMVDPDEDTHVDGVTGVHLAANKAHLNCVNLCIDACADNTILDDAGADFTIRDEEDSNPLLLAVKVNYGEVASTLVKAGADNDNDTPCIDKESESHNLVMDSIDLVAAHHACPRSPSLRKGAVEIPPPRSGRESSRKGRRIGFFGWRASRSTHIAGQLIVGKKN